MFALFVTFIVYIIALSISSIDLRSPMEINYKYTPEVGTE